MPERQDPRRGRRGGRAPAPAAVPDRQGLRGASRRTALAAVQRDRCAGSPWTPRSWTSPCPTATASTSCARSRRRTPSLPVVLLTGHGTIDLAVKAIKEGAEQFFTKPVELPALLVVARARASSTAACGRCRWRGKSSQARQARRSLLRREPGHPQARPPRPRAWSPSPAARADPGRDGDRARACSRAGSTRTGPRADEPFVDLNCAGLSRELLETELFGHEKGAFTGAVAAKPGLLEIAHRGTLFLDEIGDVDLQVQAKLLKVVEDLRFRRLGRRARPPGRRAARGRDPPRPRPPGPASRSSARTSTTGISAIPLVVPPLRERGQRRGPARAPPGGAHRRGDGPPGRAAVRRRRSRRSLSHAWPGNVRQLRNVLERAVLLSDQPDSRRRRTLGDGAAAIAGPGRGGERGMTLAEAERRHIEAVLREAQGGASRAPPRCWASRAAPSTSASRSTASPCASPRRAEDARSVSGFQDESPDRGPRGDPEHGRSFSPTPGTDRA